MATGTTATAQTSETKADTWSIWRTVSSPLVSPGERAVQLHGSVHGPGIDRQQADLRGHVGGNVVLVAAAEIFGEERLHLGHQREIVDRAGEAVALVGRDQVFHRPAVVAHGGDDLLALAELDARIVLALHHH